MSALNTIISLMTARSESLAPQLEENIVRVTNYVKADRRRKVNQYARGDRIGKGQHGEVFICFDDVAGREVALKIVKRNGPRDRIKLLRRNQRTVRDGTGSVPALSSMEHSIRKEIAVMRQCRHANVARLYEVIDDPRQDKIYLGEPSTFFLQGRDQRVVFTILVSMSIQAQLTRSPAIEYLSGGQVQWKDKEDNPLLLVEETRRIIRDVVLGLEYLHHHGIIHRDIKPANLLWTKNRTIVKIIDFGVSYFSTSQNTRLRRPGDPYDDALFGNDSDLTKRIGTPSFLAPEVLWSPDDIVEQSQVIESSSETRLLLEDAVTRQPPQRPSISKAIDVWSLAVTFYCLLFGHTPFNVPKSANENAYHNEYVLYNQIRTQDWDVEETMGSDKITTGGRCPRDLKSEGSAAISLLDRMLRKDPTDRITLGSIKQHPWILHGIPEPQEWINKTSPASMAVKEPSSFYTQWKQASGKILSLFPTARNTPTF